MLILSAALAQTPPPPPPTAPVPPAAPATAAPAPAAPAAPAKSPEDIARAAVDVAYGKPVPKAAVCFADPELPARFREVLPVAVRRGQRGCVLFGVLIGETWYTPEQALAAAVVPEAWAAADAAQRGRDLQSWTDEVLLAFVQRTDEGSVAPGPKGTFVVERGYLRREDATNASVAATGKWTFDSVPAQISAAETVTAKVQTVMYVRADQLVGVPDAAVQSALTAHGGVVKQCFNTAWEADLALEGKVRLAWTVTGGKATGIAIIADDKPPQELAACYSGAVRAGAYAPEISGTVRWVFGVERRVVP